MKVSSRSNYAGRSSFRIAPKLLPKHEWNYCTTTLYNDNGYWYWEVFRDKEIWKLCQNLSSIFIVGFGWITQDDFLLYVWEKNAKLYQVYSWFYNNSSTSCNIQTTFEISFQWVRKKIENHWVYLSLHLFKHKWFC